MFKNKIDDIIDLFYDFICLWFPESKVTEIFNGLLNEGSIDEDYYKAKKKQLKIRIKASK